LPISVSSTSFWFIANPRRTADLDIVERRIKEVHPFHGLEAEAVSMRATSDPCRLAAPAADRMTAVPEIDVAGLKRVGRGLHVGMVIIRHDPLSPPWPPDVQLGGSVRGT